MCHLLNEFPALGMMPAGVWFNCKTMEETIYNSTVIYVLKSKHCISVLNFKLMHIQHRHVIFIVLKLLKKKKK